VPETKAFFFQQNGVAPVQEWLAELRQRDRKDLPNASLD
jgi:hypothetical protein